MSKGERLAAANAGLNSAFLFPFSYYFPVPAGDQLSLQAGAASDGWYKRRKYYYLILFK